MIRWNGRRCDDDFRAECLEQADLFLGHLVGHREDAFVSAKCRGDREAHTGVSAGAFDYRPARFQLSFFFGPFNDRKPDSILDRPTRIEKLGLRVDRCSKSACDLIQPDQRRPANGFENVVVRLAVALIVLHQRVVFRFAAGAFAAGLEAEAFAESDFAVSVDLVLVTVEESRTMIESPASGGASG